MIDTNNLDYNVKPEDWVNLRLAREKEAEERKKPAIDKAVSDIVGKPILMTDPRLINLVVKWKKEKGESNTQDNFLQDPKKIEELKKTLC